MIFDNHNNMSSDNNNISKGGTSIIGVIQIVFIILKLINNAVIGKWPWWKVMLPIIISTSLTISMCCCGMGCFCMVNYFKERKKNIKTVEVCTNYPNEITITNVEPEIV